tara:strand:- start:9690 stop:10190 length:501 start_codon:yes stop_codon:yes gene_type:complete
MNILKEKPNILITIFGEEHDPRREFELVTTEDNHMPQKFTIPVKSEYGFSALVIFKEHERWETEENSYDLMHHVTEIHYMHSYYYNTPGRVKYSGDDPLNIDCAFESWTTGRNMFTFGGKAKEMHIIQSPKWIQKPYQMVEYQHHMHPPITEEVHPTWTGPVPSYA